MHFPRPRQPLRPAFSGEIEASLLFQQTPVPGGLFAQPTNIGHHERDEFAVVPEVGINVGYQVTDAIRFFGGYSFLYASDVARPANQIDTTVNVTQFAGGVLAGPPRPAFQFHTTDFWAQGISFGLEFRY